MSYFPLLGLRGLYLGIAFRGFQGGSSLYFVPTDEMVEADEMESLGKYSPFQQIFAILNFFSGFRSLPKPGPRCGFSILFMGKNWMTCRIGV